MLTAGSLLAHCWDPEITEPLLADCQTVQFGPRRASLPRKYIEELRVDTAGYLAGATMKEVKRPEGLYNVQVADHPVPPKEGLKWWPSWFDEVVETVPHTDSD